MKTPLRRLIAVAILAGWLTPGLAAAAIGLHVALEHHHPGRGEHARSVADLLRTAAHGHHHEVGSAPEHRHDARIAGGGPAIAPAPAVVATLAAPAAPTVVLAEGQRLDGSRRRGPPRPLFTAHCSLLL